MLSASRTDILRWTLLGALGASLTFSCGGSTENSSGGKVGDGDGDGNLGDGDSGDGDGGDGDGTVGDGDGPTGDGDSTVGDGDGDGGGGGLPECTNPVDLGGGFVRCEEGYTHRGDPSACSTTVPRPEQIGDPDICSAENGCCMTDADCAGSNQYCKYQAGQIVGAWCVQGCLTDSDCGDGMICQCGDPMGQCVTAQCTSDDDCPGEARCASFATDNGCGPWTQYTCQTVDDECAADADCGEGMECDGTGGVRQCVTQQFLCAIGRPFVVGGEFRVAPLCERLDWAEDLAPNLDGLGPDERRTLAQAWQEAAQMEHASVAAFARFSMHLLSLGAPVDLIEQTNQALTDETRHAKLCFGLASAYRGQRVGPTALDISQALTDHSLETIVATAIVEGCLGETAAALEAAEAAVSCQDETVKEVLLQISQEESRHAELAWRFVRWALAENPHLRGFVQSQFGHLLSELSSERAPVAPGTHEKWGVLCSERREEIRLVALREVVAPCARQLLIAPVPQGATAETELHA